MLQQPALHAAVRQGAPRLVQQQPTRQQGVCQAAARPPRPPRRQASGASKEPNGRELNDWIVKAPSSTQVLQLVVAHGHSCDRVNAATALHRVAAKHNPADRQSVLGHPGWSLLLTAVGAHMHSFKARELGNSLWALGRLRQAPESLLTQLLPAAEAAMPTFKAQELSNTLLGLAHMACVPDAALLLAAEQQLLSVLQDAIPQSISNPLWAFATLQHRPSAQLLTEAAQHFISLSQTASPQNISNLLWAYATLGVQPGSQLLSACAERLLATLAGAKPQDVANALWAFGQLGHNPGNTFMAEVLRYCMQNLQVS